MSPRTWPRTASSKGSNQSASRQVSGVAVAAGVVEHHHALHPGAVHEQRHVVGRAFYLRLVVLHGRVLGHDGDSAPALEVDVVHDPVLDLLVGTESSGLFEHGVDKGRLAVVDVGDDGDVPEIQHSLPSV